MRHILLSLSGLLILGAAVSAQTVQITGKILEWAAMGPVPGATVVWKSANGATLTTTADTGGNFTLTGTPASLSPRQLVWKGPLMERGLLRLETVEPNVRVEASLHDSKGVTLTRSSHLLASPGFHEVPVLAGAPRGFVGFLRVRAGDESYRLKVIHAGGPAPVTQASFVQAAGSLAKTGAAGDTLIVSMAGLLTSKIANPTNSGAQADVIMEYPARDSIGVGASRPYGAIVLFDGRQGPAAALAEMQAKWLKWRDWPNGCQANSSGSTKNTSPANFAIAQDPQFPEDTSRVALRTRVVTGSATQWGCDDIEARPNPYAHGDVQLHVEFNLMGVYSTSDPDNPNATATYGESSSAAYYVNSGVYVQNRYEIQVRSNALGVPITNSHNMGSIVNEFAPSSNQGKDNGVWQAYDITFRTARYNGTTKTADGRMSVWWNGVLVHNNRTVTGAATGVANTSGEAMNNQLFGLKLQREANDVRYRNIWMKHLKIDSTGTNFGY